MAKGFIGKLASCEHFASFITFLFLQTTAYGYTWLSIASLSAIDTGIHHPNHLDLFGSSESSLVDDNNLHTGICTQVPGLVNEQRLVCERAPETLPVIGEGARTGILECKRQFKNERWNCTLEPNAISDIEKVLERGSRETAFVYAVTSAGVVHAVTRKCSEGNLTECTCDLSRQGGVTADGWHWGGCSDNVAYGVELGRKFVDAADTEEAGQSGKDKVRSNMNIHNNEVGRLAVATQMTTACRCHGVSGSCTVKSCWKTMPSFLQVGDYLKTRYQQSVEVLNRPKKKLRRRDKRMRKVSIPDDDLVHVDSSPNYCRSDPEKGILGTVGRECNRTSDASDSCDLLCCGRGYNTMEVRQVDRCDCKFFWCCEVRCKTCETVRDMHTCK
ncbi:protein Wnt-16-like [Amphiura filiformis]|uniref:protein Wnt-16-like n=1 Tax=Amphiura filiformis TaxID=82378 RepID=UPI003B222E38